MGREESGSKKIVACISWVYRIKEKSNQEGKLLTYEIYEQRQ